MKYLVWCVLLFLGCSSTTSYRSSKDRAGQPRVIIDPGHGGDDAGAVGKRGLMEKDLTLDIARRLKRIFNEKLPHVKVILTRTSDQHVGLEERIAIAHQKKGDVFLSLHINSNESKEARGFQVFSLDVASDRHGERLAARENKTIRKNGADFILADLRAFSHRHDSDKLAKNIALGLRHELKKIMSTEDLNDRGYDQAIFHVLFVKMPAILAELFFISNAREEYFLSQKDSREAIARGLFLGTRKFLDETVLRAEHVP